MQRETDKPKVMDVSRSKKQAAERVVPSRQIMVEHASHDEDTPSGEPKAEEAQPLATENRKVVEPVSADMKQEKQEEAAPQPAEQEEQEAPETPTDQPTPTEDVASPPAEGEPSADTKKAIEEAAKETARQQEIEKAIDSRQFFVPTGTVARKKSDKISALLAFLVALLALILIDLMLDSGSILLVQKIPHTHFFGGSQQ